VLVATSTALLRTLRGPLQAVPAIACSPAVNMAGGGGGVATLLQRLIQLIHSAGLRRVLLMMLRNVHSENRPTATGEKKNYLLYMVDAISGKSLKLLPPDVIF